MRGGETDATRRLARRRFIRSGSTWATGDNSHGARSNVGERRLVERGAWHASSSPERDCPERKRSKALAAPRSRASRAPHRISVPRRSSGEPARSS
jgi:hypothetical protein